MDNSISVIFGRFEWLLALLFSAVVLILISVLPLFLAPLALAGLLLTAYYALLFFVSVKTQTQKLE